MDVTVTFADTIPVLTLNGRFDGYGALRFDETAQELSSDAAFWVIDFTGVGYLSSVGVGSLLAIEQTLQGRSGGVILTGLTPFVKQLLDITGLTARLRVAPALADAVAMARSAARLEPGADHTLRGRQFRVRRVPHAASTIEWWAAGAEPGGVDDRLVSVTLDELGFAFGTGGLGVTASDARAAAGRFVSTPSFAGLLPALGHGVSDFMTGGPAAVPVHVSTALGMCGEPEMVVDVTAPEPFRLVDAIADLFDVATAETGVSPGVMGLVAMGEGADAEPNVLACGVAFDERDLAHDEHGARLRAWDGPVPLAPDRAIVGGAVTLQRSATWPTGSDVGETARLLASIETLQQVFTLESIPALDRARIWVFLPLAIRDGTEKLLKVDVEDGSEWLPEWDAIVRRLYSNCRSVTLTPLHGGYMSKTFRVVAYDRDGRRMLPTVLKVGATALTTREEQANRQYVARFILNNGTTVLGGAQEGEWAGIRYNFLGVNGPESRLVWLREHYLSRPTVEVLPLLEALVTRVLKPWYAQPRWEQVFLYRDHTPLRLFPSLIEVAERELDISADDPVFRCDELGLDLPNPFRFLKHEYPKCATDSRLWYTTICHGDLNMQNVLVDERENVYVIDFSETRPRNAVSDFARIEPILKFEMTRIESDDDLRRLVEFEAGLTSVTSLSDSPPLRYTGTDPMVAKAHAAIVRLRSYANTVTLFETDMVPYWIAMLEWTYSVVCYVQLSSRHKRYAACSAALLCRAIQQAEAGH